MGSTNHIHSAPPARETTDADLVEAVERTDAGVRLALPHFAEVVGIGRTGRSPIAEAPVAGAEEPEIDEVLIGRVAAQMSEWRDEAARELRHLDKNAPRAIYVQAFAVVAHLGDFLDAVREHQKEGV